MIYVCYELDSEPELSFKWYDHISNFLATKIEPQINPDFHDKYDSVVYWWLELNKNEIPVREIGFNDLGEPIVIGPFGINKGLFTRCKQKIKGFYPVEMYQFVEQWENYLKSSADNSFITK